ncbi:M16 family metallopeptidase [Fretibacter rubidus]|uniref:M16 family metallopeptidase n=1 Tax=Fretibacter rubidus TaxID=570162 RepID=UPI00352AADE3
MTFSHFSFRPVFTGLAAVSLLSAPLVLSACSPATDSAQSAKDATSALTLDFEKYTLDNGLDVVLHVDRSDPIVAINLAVHVGSAREVTGRTGFAHLFEHLLFLDSENLGYGGLDEMNTRIGGEGTNGFTTNDMTQYFQAVPADALEKVVWAEADKLGYFINTVTQGVIDNEKQVVKNEKRQRVDNVPYGHNWYIIGKALYPTDHPYNWQVIGSLADLDAATLDDVKDFYKRWYVPNNVTVTITGDFDPSEAKAYVEKYFGEIPRGPLAEPYPARASNLTETTSLYYEDNFAKLPQFTAVWPTVEKYHPDSYALDILSTYLTDGKSAPLNEVLIDETKVTSGVTTFHNQAEIAGEFYLIMRGEEGQPLERLSQPIADGFARFEENGIPQAALDRIKASLEVGFYNEIQSVLGKAIQLGEDNLFTGDPGFYKTRLAGLNAVTTEDVMRVYNAYIKDRPRLYTSVVPAGQADLVLDGAVKADIVEEKIVPGADAAVEFDPTARTFTPTPSSFDRTVEPDFGAAYTLPSPQVWTGELSNGVSVHGIESRETPLVYFSMTIDAGRKRGDVAKPAVPALTADMMLKGTENKSTAELEDAIKSLGSDVSVNIGSETVSISGNSLARNFDATIALVTEFLTEPAWDAEEFELLKIKTLNAIKTAEADPGSISRRETAKLLYPEDHIYHYTTYGPEEALGDVTLDDLKAFHRDYYAPASAKLKVVGAVDKADVKRAFSPMASAWNTVTMRPITLAPPNEVTESKVYFFDVPGAKQSTLRIQRPSLLATDPDFPLVEAINFPLGGIYTSRLNNTLRVEKGYTYGIGSRFSASDERGFFFIGSSVRSNVTTESLELIKDIVGNYGTTFSEDDLSVMKDALLRGQALKTETLSDKLSLVSQISNYGYAPDFKAVNAERIANMTVDDVKALVEKYMPVDAMNYVVVGDAQTQAEGTARLGFGEPVMIGSTKEE